MAHFLWRRWPWLGGVLVCVMVCISFELDSILKTQTESNPSNPRSATDTISPQEVKPRAWTEATADLNSISTTPNLPTLQPPTEATVPLSSTFPNPTRPTNQVPTNSKPATTIAASNKVTNPSLTQCVDPPQPLPLSCGNSEVTQSSVPSEFQIVATPSTITNAATISVEWVVPNATAHDVVVAVSSHKPTAPIATKKIDAQEWAKGKGVVTFKLLNMRTSYTFKYIQNRENMELISNPVCGETNTPLYGHLGLTHDPSQVSLMWINGVNATPMVRYGLSADELTSCSTGTSATYTVRDLSCMKKNHKIKNLARNNFWDPGLIHTAMMGNLKPSTRYYYQYGSSWLEGGWSEVFDFLSPPHQNNKEFSFIGLADLGTITWKDTHNFPEYWECPGAPLTTSRIADHIKAEPPLNPEFVLHAGDISYAVGFAPRWEQFHHEVHPIARAVPYLVSDGNHDAGDDAFGECGVPFQTRFKSPNHNPLLSYYSLDYSYMHLIVVSTEIDPVQEPTTASYKWLEEDLASVDPQKTPWIVVAGHKPLYTSDTHLTRVREAMRMQRALEPLFEKFNVAVYFGGHVHNYERTCALRGRRCVDDGFISIEMGTAGAITHPRDFSTEQPLWSARRHSFHGFGKFRVTPTEFEFQFIRSSNGQLQDHFLLQKVNGTNRYHNKWDGPTEEDVSLRPKKKQP